MQEYYGILEKCPLFKGVSRKDISEMLICLKGKTVTYRKTEIIFAEGEKAGYIGIVLSGAVQISRTDYYGTRSIVATVQPSEMFGEVFACADVSYVPIDAYAQTDTTVLMLNFKSFMDVNTPACEFKSKLITNMIKIIASKNLLLHQKMEIMSKRTTKEKLMAYLLFQAKKEGSNRFSITFDRQELADYLGVDRSGLSAEIGKLCRAGVLKCNKNQFEIVK